MNALAQINTDTAVRIPVPGTDYMICASVFAGPLGARHTVLFEGQYFVINDGLRDLLMRGETPAMLELEPSEVL
jgi:hypothetical protein